MGDYAPTCKCRQSKVNVQPCPLHEPQKIINLNISNQSYTGCMGMERFNNLLSLTLVFNKLRDVSFLADLPQLKLLNVQHNKIESLQGLVANGMANTSLVALKVSCNNLTDLSTVSQCTNLEELWASHNPFASVTVLGDLSGLHKLTRLVFSPNKCCAADPRLYIVGRLKAVTMVDGHVVTQVMRDKARDYLAKGFAPPPTPPDTRPLPPDEVDGWEDAELRLPRIAGPERRVPAQSGNDDSDAAATSANQVTTGNMLASIMDCLPDLSSFGSAAAKVSKPPKHHDRTQRRKIRGKKSDYKQPSANSTTPKTASSQTHRPSSSDSLSGPSSRRSVTTDKQESREPKSKPKTKLKPKPTKTKLKPKPNANTSEPRAPEPVATQSELRLYYTKKKKVLAILIRANGTAVAKWPNNKIAVSVDHNGAGWSIFASHHSTFNSAIALNFDFAGAGFVNHAPPCSSMMLSVAADGSGMLMNQRCEMQTRWESASAPYKHMGGDMSAGDAGNKWCVDQALSKHLGVRFGRTGSELEVFFKCKGMHYKFVRGYNHSVGKRCGKQPAGLSVMGRVQARKKKKTALTHGQRISSIRSAVSGL